MGHLSSLIVLRHEKGNTFMFFSVHSLLCVNIYHSPFTKSVLTRQRQRLFFLKFKSISNQCELISLEH